MSLPHCVRLLSFANEDLKKNNQFRARAIQMARTQFHDCAKRLGIRVVSEYVTGSYDLITILETTDPNAMLRVTKMNGSIKGITNVQTLEAVPAEDLQKRSVMRQ